MTTTPTEARILADRMTERGRTYVPEDCAAALRSLSDQVEALTAERDSYKKDAERYRAIRQGLQVDENSGFVISLIDDFGGGETLRNEVADKAIDAAIKEAAT